MTLNIMFNIRGVNDVGFLSDSPQESKDFKIHIKTGDVWWAGTDSNVYITMCGRLECLRSYHLKHSSTHSDPFERSQVDVFIVPSLSLGNFKNVTIWHDGSGYFPTWFLKNIRIVETFAGMEPTFTYSCWIKGNDPKTLYLQIPGSCHSLDEREPKRPNDKFSMGTHFLYFHSTLNVEGQGHMVV
uniref:PLAT domain-containing protein n=1 Tax=Eptatretus burgeri TaxID=7764 RepID=A0A8C4WPD2_EPTBU